MQRYVAFEGGVATAPAPTLGSRALHHASRFIIDVTIVVGVLLVIEAGITVLWQEPLTSYLASRAQAGLEDDLAALEDEALAVTGVDQPPTPLEFAATMAGRLEARTDIGGALGRVNLPTQDRSYAMVQGTGEGPLEKGPGHYVDTSLPGQKGTVAIAGHRTTYLAPFRDIDDLDKGDPIVVDMPYGTFTYKVERTLIVDPGAVWVKGPVDHDRVVLTACHPPFSAAERIIVFGALEQFDLRGYDVGASAGLWGVGFSAPS